MASKFVNRDNFGEALHVALRKGCYSSATSAAWNCINMMPGSVWREFVDYVYASLSNAKSLKPPRTEENVWRHLMTAALRYDPHMIESLHDPKVMKLIRDLPEEEIAGQSFEAVISLRRQWRVLLHSILSCFSESDWKGFSCYLYN